MDPDCAACWSPYPQNGLIHSRPPLALHTRQNIADMLRKPSSLLPTRCCCPRAQPIFAPIFAAPYGALIALQPSLSAADQLVLPQTALCPSLHHSLQNPVAHSTLHLQLPLRQMPPPSRHSTASISGRPPGHCFWAPSTAVGEHLHECPQHRSPQHPLHQACS